MVTLGVLAWAPTAGACLPKIAPSIGDENAAKLYAAMLRDTLDGFLHGPFDRFMVFGATEQGGLAVLARHVHAPWELVAQRGTTLNDRLANAMSDAAAGGGAVVVARSDVPTAPTSDLERAAAHLAAPRGAILGATERGGAWLVGLSAPADPQVFRVAPWTADGAAAKTRAFYTERGLGLLELGEAYDVSTEADVDRLAAELRRHPERGPRSADFFVKMPRS
jgi:hypothetical protein